MDFKLRPMALKDREAVIDINNYYVLNSFAAYAENAVPYEFFDSLMARAQGYPTAVVVDADDDVLGYGMLRAYYSGPVFAQTAVLSLFIHPEHRRAGLGSAILQYLIDGARQRSIRTILASISSKNEPSIAFHAKNGFTEAGRMKSVGIKRGEPFDEVWMQKMI